MVGATKIFPGRAFTPEDSLWEERIAVDLTAIWDNLICPWMIIPCNGQVGSIGVRQWSPLMAISWFWILYLKRRQDSCLLFSRESQRRWLINADTLSL